MEPDPGRVIRHQAETIRQQAQTIRRRALENTPADRRCRFLCIFNWEGIRDSAAVLEAIRQVIAASADRNRPQD